MRHLFISSHDPIAGASAAQMRSSRALEPTGSLQLLFDHSLHTSQCWHQASQLVILEQVFRVDEAFQILQMSQIVWPSNFDC